MSGVSGSRTDSSLPPASGMLRTGIALPPDRRGTLKLEDIRPECILRGIRADDDATVVGVKWHGSDALTLTYRTTAGGVAEELLFRNDEARLELVSEGRPWSFDGDGALYRLVSEAHRIRLAHLFDPMLAVHTSDVDPLPHQITAVYEAMLPRQPLRFLLADDPGVGGLHPGHRRVPRRREAPRPLPARTVRAGARLGRDQQQLPHGRPHRPRGSAVVTGRRTSDSTKRTRDAP